jgi:hypothetical protein
LRSRTGHAHVANQLMGHAARVRAGLTRVVCHAGSHGMVRGPAGMLLHAAGMRRKCRGHISHHLRRCRLSTAWISAGAVRRYRMRGRVWVPVRRQWPRRPAGRRGGGEGVGRRERPGRVAGARVASTSGAAVSQRRTVRRSDGATDGANAISRGDLERRWRVPFGLDLGCGRGMRSTDGIHAACCATRQRPANAPTRWQAKPYQGSGSAATRGQTAAVQAIEVGRQVRGLGCGWGDSELVAATTCRGRRE